MPKKSHCSYVGLCCLLELWICLSISEVLLVHRLKWIAVEGKWCKGITNMFVEQLRWLLGDSQEPLEVWLYGESSGF